MLGARLVEFPVGLFDLARIVAAQDVQQGHDVGLLDDSRRRGQSLASAQVLPGVEQALLQVLLRLLLQVVAVELEVILKH